MKKKIIISISLGLIFLLNACSNKDANKYIKLAEFAEGSDSYVTFIDNNTDEIVFVYLNERKIEKKIPIK